VPFTAVGKYHFTGYLNEETTGQEIEAAVQCAIKNGCQDIVGELISQEIEVEKTSVLPEIFSLPILGKVNLKNFSLPLITIIFGLLDGFNPCAMWVLLFLISLLLGIHEREKRWLLGFVFIAVSALVYFLFMSAWLNLFLFLGFVIWVRILIGLLALTAGGYNLRDYFANKHGECKVVKSKRRKKVFTRIKKIIEKKNFLLALGGIVLLAFAVNLVELVCSAGLPAIYTQILVLNKIPQFQYYFYLLLYILFFMLDDLIIFSLAMITLQAVGIEGKYARFSHLIGGALMILIGLLMIFKPEVLMFG
jgi:hypothetical protein